MNPRDIAGNAEEEQQKEEEKLPPTIRHAQYKTC